MLWKFKNMGIKSISRRSLPLIKYRNKIILRVLYGDPLPHILSEVDQCFRDNKALNDRTIFAALGQKNYNFLKKRFKNVVLFSKKKILDKTLQQHFWHKTYIISKFLEEYKEVLYLDFDTLTFNPNKFNETDLLLSFKILCYSLFFLLILPNDSTNLSIKVK